jgi:hypothetical protein
MCSFQTQVDQTVITTFSELFIPARTLAYGIYELKLTVTMVAWPSLISSASAYVKINPSSITANLVLFGTSLITSDPEKDLTIDPGAYSVDPDSTTFNASVSFYIFIYLKLRSIYIIHRIGTTHTIVNSMIFIIRAVMTIYFRLIS